MSVAPKAPAVSVVVTAYNSRDFFIEALDSVLAQTFTDWELIVVDDGSHENGKAFIQNAIKDLPRTRLMRQPNRGLPAARNTGAAAARGQFIAFLDHDDIWETRFLETMVAALSQRLKEGAVFCRVRHMTEDGTCTDRVSKPPMSRLSVSDLLVADPVCCGSAMLLRREALEQVEGFDVEMLRAQTPECFIRIIQAGWQISGVSDVLVRYRNTPGSLMEGNVLRKYRRHMFHKTLNRGKYPFLSVLRMRLLMEVNILRIKLRRNLVKAKN